MFLRQTARVSALGARRSAPLAPRARSFHSSPLALQKLREFSPIFTERATNFMDDHYKQNLQYISKTIKEIFHGHSVALVPGSGTSGMEAIARQFAHDKRALYLRNGYFGFRWEEILTQGKIPSQLTTLSGREVQNGQFGPHPIEDVEFAIQKHRPEVIFFSHVDTSTGILLPDEYIKRVSSAGHAVGALIVLDCIASGALWANMKELGLDVIVTAPQKGLSAQASCGIVVMNEHVRKTRIDTTTSSSYALDLKRWLAVMEAFEQGGMLYHATPPTDGILSIATGLRDTVAFGVEKATITQREMGQEVRKYFADKGIKSVAPPGFASPSVLVFFSPETDPAITVTKLKQAGVKVGGALSFMLGEKDKPKTFRIGMLGIDKMKNKEETLAFLKEQISKIF